MALVWAAASVDGIELCMRRKQYGVARGQVTSLTEAGAMDQGANTMQGACVCRGSVLLGSANRGAEPLAGVWTHCATIFHT